MPDLFRGSSGGREGNWREERTKAVAVMDDCRAMGRSLLSTFGLNQRPVVAICSETEPIPMLVVEPGFPDLMKIAVVVNALILRYLNLIIERE